MVFLFLLLLLLFGSCRWPLCWLLLLLIACCCKYCVTLFTILCVLLAGPVNENEHANFEDISCELYIHMLSIDTIISAAAPEYFAQHSDAHQMHSSNTHRTHRRSSGGTPTATSGLWLSTRCTARSGAP